MNMTAAKSLIALLGKSVKCWGYTCAVYDEEKKELCRDEPEALCINDRDVHFKNEAGFVCKRHLPKLDEYPNGWKRIL